MATPEQRKQEKAERKARWKHAQEHGTGAYEPKKWEKAPKKYPNVKPLDLPPSLVSMFIAAQRTIRRG